ncbi:MAG: hypothetical protein FJ271_13520 [Planctomycetes bacterium]|nr:hypothetical protein [Planctomycetota bacterium]
MAIAVVCSGCGQLLQVSPDDPRPEIECLWCGGKTVVARPVASPQSPPPAVGTAQIGDDILPGDELGLAPAERNETQQLSATQPATVPRWYEQAPYSLEDPRLQPSASPAPTPLSTPLATPAPASIPSSQRGGDDDDDSQPYEVDAKQDRPCPDCGRFVKFDAAVCLSCGFDLRSGKRLKKTYEPISRAWESGWPLATRKMLFAIGQGVMLPMSIIGAISLGSPLGFIGPWGVFTAMTIYLLGTCNRVELSRTKKGKVTLTQTWFVFFQRRPAQTISLSEYDGVTSGTVYKADFWDWMVTVVWLGSGFIWGVFITLPLIAIGLAMAILWWYYFVNKETYYVALTKDHGHPALHLYRGWSEPQMHNMADTIKDIAFAVSFGGQP